jgi:hypothetical protein
MKVRDKSLPKTDYKGLETEAIDPSCPCRPCWHPHDCGYMDNQAKWHPRMYCATNWNSGCPVERPTTHLFPQGKRKCVRCGAGKPAAVKVGKP